MNLGALVDLTEYLKGVSIATAKEAGFTPGPEHFDYLLRVLCADTDEQAIEVGRTFMWTEHHRQRHPREHNDPPGYQSREALQVKMRRPTIGTGSFGQKMGYDALRAVNNLAGAHTPTSRRSPVGRPIGCFQPGPFYRVRILPPYSIA